MPAQPLAPNRRGVIVAHRQVRIAHVMPSTVCHASLAAVDLAGEVVGTQRGNACCSPCSLQRPKAAAAAAAAALLQVVVAVVMVVEEVAAVEVVVIEVAAMEVASMEMAAVEVATAVVPAGTL